MSCVKLNIERQSYSSSDDVVEFLNLDDEQCKNEVKNIMSAIVMVLLTRVIEFGLEKTLLQLPVLTSDAPCYKLLSFCVQAYVDDL